MLVFQNKQPKQIIMQNIEAAKVYWKNNVVWDKNSSSGILTQKYYAQNESCDWAIPQNHAVLYFTLDKAPVSVEFRVIGSLTTTIKTNAFIQLNDGVRDCVYYEYNQTSWTSGEDAAWMPFQTNSQDYNFNCWMGNAGYTANFDLTVELRPIYQ